MNDSPVKLNAGTLNKRINAVKFAFEDLTVENAAEFWKQVFEGKNYDYHLD